MAKPKEEEEERSKKGYSHAERTAGNFRMWLTAIGELCWQVKETFLTEGRPGRLTLFLGGVYFSVWTMENGWGGMNTSGVINELGSV